MRDNTIIQGDCVEVLREFPDGSIDLIFADPPYNMQLQNDLYRPNNTKVKGVDDAWDKFSSFAEYDAFCGAWLRECKRVLKDSGSIWVIGSYHNIFRIGNIMQNLGFWILNDVIWHKTNPMPNFLGVRFTNATETLLWCAKDRDHRNYTFNHKLMKRCNGNKQMTSVWRIGLCVGEERLKGRDGKKAHSTQKPEELLKRVILSSSSPGDTVLDPFFGTGTTGAAAKKLKRVYIGIEKEPAYIALARARIEGITECWPESGWAEEKKGRKDRVPFAALVRARVIRAGDSLYAKKNPGAEALVLADGTLQYRHHIGSIHKIGALIQGAPSCNGWKFWSVTRGGDTILIDQLRTEYLESKGPR
jgi:modification methylase